MKLIDLTQEHEALFALCLEDWSADAKEAGSRRSQWITRFRERGLKAKLALDDKGIPGGMIQHLPIEQSLVDGEGLHFIPCVWVHGHKQGRGNFQKQGMGSALLEEAEASARASGAKGMAAWGIWLPFWMRASWFKKHGYRKADRQGIAVLLWKPFAPGARAPRWFKRATKLPQKVEGKVNVVSFNNGWCLAGNLTAERARRASLEFGDRVVFQEIDTSEHSTMAEWGISDAVFVDGKEVSSGPPPSYEKIRGILAKRVKRL